MLEFGAFEYLKTLD